MNTTIYQDEIDEWILVWKLHQKRSGSNHPGAFESLVEFIEMAEIAIQRLVAEFDRLKRGDFTEIEFQNLCHRFQDSDADRFANGCVEYMNNLFGHCPLIMDKTTRS